VVLGQTGHRLGRNRIDRLFHASRVFLREVTHEERNFRALFITRIEIRESVIYDGKQQGLVEWEGQNQPEIELYCTTQQSRLVGLSRRRIEFNLGLTCGLVQIIIAADNIKTAHDFTSSHNRHHRYLLIHSHEMLLQQRDIRKSRIHCDGVGAWQRNP
jgi:hypothetical protein